MSQTEDRDFALGKVKESHKKGFLPMLVLMLGFTFFSASMWTGGELGTKVTASEFIIAVLFGNLILGIYTASLAYISADTGLSTHLLAKYSFGKVGAHLPSILLSVTQVGWFGVGVAMFALPLQKVTGWDLQTIIIVSGLVMTLTALFGIKSLTILSFIAVPSIAVLGCYSVGKSLFDFGGTDALFNIQPTETIPMYTAISMCVATFISGGTLTPDFTRFSKNKKTAVSTTLIAFFLGNSLMFIFGAVGAAFYKESDISNVLMQQGMIVIAMIVLGLNIWTTNDNALYASGLGISNITQLPKKIVVLINGVLGTLLALWLYNNFVGWLSFLNTMLPSIGGVIIADYFLVKKGVYCDYTSNTFQKIRWTAIVAWVMGVLAAQYLPGIPPLNGVISAIVSYWIFEKVQLSIQSKKQLETN
ncbi:cytosine permease [Sediminitomix flava]|uniref:Cytosine permease n=1 Tax=Sediminitomix flava TaxID=379075 RepID=A0A315ZUX6_SEDFL|nr:cytosine permease [Sediminitomix flava]PWJ39989.1 cytosine permease [Sediminitomix flava]